MKKKLAVIFTLIFIIPLLSIGYLGFKIANDDHTLLKQKHLQLLNNELQQVANDLRAEISVHQKLFHGLCSPKIATPTTLRSAAASQRFVKQFFLLNAGGQLEYPVSDESISREEQSFLDRTAHIWHQRAPFKNVDEAQHAEGDHGFYTWFHNRGLNILYWTKQTNGTIVGIEIEKTAFISQLIASLPETQHGAAREKQIRLVETNGTPVYIFGSYEPESTTHPVASQEIATPLSSWRLQYFSPPLSSTGMMARQTWYTFFTIGTLLTIMLVLMGYFVIEYNRETRLAKQQVSFVNQVSHELKTPLTNIRMYGELLADRLEEDDDRSKRYVANIVNESGRLSRLIQNVLSFARSSHGKLRIRKQKRIIDESIRSVVEQFRPIFSRLDIEVNLNLNANTPVYFDSDALGQVVTNLCSNVEKYAHEGKWIEIESQQSDSIVQIFISDRGPGISKSQIEKVFAPFVRLNNDITEGATGTGIGLTISKELAILQGGDLTVVPTENGSKFALRIAAKEDFQ